MCVIFCEKFIHLSLQSSVKPPNYGALYVGIVTCMKINCLTFKLLLDSCINKFSTLSDCIVIGFLSWNKNFIAVVELWVLSFSASLKTYRENMAMNLRAICIFHCISNGNIIWKINFSHITDICYIIWFTWKTFTNRFVQVIRVLNRQLHLQIPFFSFTGLY